MPQVVPVQIDFPEPLQTIRAEILVAALAPLRIDAVSLRDGYLPRLLERRRSHSSTASRRDVPIGTTRVRRLLVVLPRRTISRRFQSISSNRSASISPRRMPVSSGTMIIDRNVAVCPLLQ